MLRINSLIGFGSIRAVGGGVATDPNIANVKLLLGFEGADAATSTSDESPAAKGAATFNGNAQLDTAQAKFGASSLLLDGSGDSIQWADSADWDLSDASGDLFTVEAWIMPHAASNSAIVAQGSFGANRFAFALWFTAARQLAWYSSTTGSTITDTISSGGGVGIMTLDTWNHVAADKDGTGKVRIYVNGAMTGSGTPGANFFNSTDPLKIGTSDAIGDFNGWVDELRITKGTARYASDSGYTTPTAAFPRS